MVCTKKQLKWPLRIPFPHLDTDWQGATSCWENWSGESDATHPPQPTHNHIFLCGGVGEWMYTHVAGISLPASPGFSQILLSPKFQ